MDTPNTLLSEREASARLKEKGVKIEPTTLRKYRCVGGGPEFRHFGRRPVYEPAALDRWISEKLSPPKRSTSDRGEAA